MKIKKARVWQKTQGLDESFEQLYSKPFRIQRQYLCSFCWRELSENSVRFNGFGACSICFKLSHFFVDSLRRHKREYKKRFGGEE